MQVVLLRVGIDSGCGGMQGPLFRDGTFEYVPIPDEFRGTGVGSLTYGTARGRHGKALVIYFPAKRRHKYLNKPIHFDPEFKTFTYGDPTPPKARLRTLQPGDLLVFYAGLERWPEGGQRGLYIIGFFNVLMAGRAIDFTRSELTKHFGNNFHVRHDKVLKRQRNELVLVKGGAGSRLLREALLISTRGRDKRGRPLHILSPYMRKIFGDFQGHVSIQRSPPRWVDPSFIKRAVDFVSSLC